MLVMRSRTSQINKYYNIILCTSGLIYLVFVHRSGSKGSAFLLQDVMLEQPVLLLHLFDHRRDVVLHELQLLLFASEGALKFDDLLDQDVTIRNLGREFL